MTESYSPTLKEVVERCTTEYILDLFFLIYPTMGFERIFPAIACELKAEKNATEI